VPLKRKVKRGARETEQAGGGAARGAEMTVLPKREKVTGPFVTSSVRLPKSLLQEVDELAVERGYSRNVVMYELMRAGLRMAREEHASTTEVQVSVEETKQLRAQVDALLAEVQVLKRKR